MRSLNLPTYSFKLKSENDKQYIFDTQRKKYVRLTPEEWVRQNFVKFLVKERSFPAGRIILEKTLIYNKLIKRCDILVYDRNMQPSVLIECKAPEVRITSRVFDQASVYNLIFKVRFLIVTNGLSHYCARIHYNEKKVEFLREIPFYEKLIQDQ